MRIVLSALAALVFLPLSAWAGEIRVIDDRGLTRVTQQLTTSARVVVQTKDAASQKLTLTNVSGILPDITAQAAGNGRYVFHNVAQGTWKVVFEGEHLPIKEIRVEK